MQINIRPGNEDDKISLYDAMSIPESRVDEFYASIKDLCTNAIELASVPIVALFKAVETWAITTTEVAYGSFMVAKLCDEIYNAIQKEQMLQFMGIKGHPADDLIKRALEGTDDPEQN